MRPLLSSLLFALALPLGAADRETGDRDCEEQGKRNLVSVDRLPVSATNGYPDRDFIASTDERFRPVSELLGSEVSLAP